MRPGPGPFVGRSWERRELADALAGGLGGRGELVLVSGEPGIGKTRLVREAVAEVEAGGSGHEVVWAACWNGDDAPPYWPWVQVVRGLGAFAGVPGGPARRDAGTIARLDREALAILVPELQAGHVPAEAPVGDHAAARLRLFEAVVDLLRAAAGHGPLVVADRASSE